MLNLKETIMLPSRVLRSLIKRGECLALRHVSKILTTLNLNFINCFYYYYQPSWTCMSKKE